MLPHLISLFNLSLRTSSACSITALLALCPATCAVADTATLPIADAHVHYSHDSVDMTPPARVIELMREANLKFALVSSSDDNGTQQLSELAPDLIVPGLRPYRRRGETGSWFRDPEALAYVERLLATNRYASIGEFHLFGDNAELAIPRRIVELAAEHDLVLHAHADADAIERLLAQDADVKVLWAHGGFENPGEIATMLDKHDRLWADLAFRSDVGGGGLDDDWTSLFEAHPNRIMLGTDTYTPERIHFIPIHATESRTWLADLPEELAEKIAWRNAYDLLMPIWETNRRRTQNTAGEDAVSSAVDNIDCGSTGAANESVIDAGELSVRITPLDAVVVSQPLPVEVALCGTDVADAVVTLDARMPAHGHGMNYTPELSEIRSNAEAKLVRADGVVLHMPGDWQWSVDIRTGNERRTLTSDFRVD